MQSTPYSQFYPLFSSRVRLFLLLVVFALQGCTVSQEDHDFYYSGWVNPNKKAAAIDPVIRESKTNP